MDWMRLTLSAEQVAGGVASRYRARFFDAFADAHAPRLMALFQQQRDDGGLDLFFTPDCVAHADRLLQEWGCVPCKRPSMVGLHLLVGHNEMTYYMP